MLPEPTTFLPLTPAELQILVALAEGERHGYAIMQAITANTGGALRVGPGTLYGRLKRLLQAALIEETLASASGSNGNAPERAS